MKSLLLIAVLALPQIGLSTAIPHLSSSSSCCHPENTASTIIPRGEQSLSAHPSTVSVMRREPSPAHFKSGRLGRNKSLYELNGEKATDHLYDIKNENKLGNEVVEKESEGLMGQIWHIIRGSTEGSVSGEQCICE